MAAAVPTTRLVGSRYLPCTVIQGAQAAKGVHDGPNGAAVFASPRKRRATALAVRQSLLVPLPRHPPAVEA